jgi:hypothetical protein
LPAHFGACLISRPYRSNGRIPYCSPRSTFRSACSPSLRLSFYSHCGYAQKPRFIFRNRIRRCRKGGIKPLPEYSGAIPRPPGGPRESGHCRRSTLWHEQGHAVGHPKRLNRESIKEVAPFGSAVYSLEECIAEMTAPIYAGSPVSKTAPSTTPPPISPHGRRGSVIIASSSSTRPRKRSARANVRLRAIGCEILLDPLAGNGQPAHKELRNAAPLKPARHLIAHQAHS